MALYKCPSSALLLLLLLVVVFDSFNEQRNAYGVHSIIFVSCCVSQIVYIDAPHRRTYTSSNEHALLQCRGNAES